MASIFDIHHEITVETALNPQAITTNTTTDGEIIDLQFYEGLELIFASKTVTDGDYVVNLFESDDSGMSPENAVSSSQVLGSISFAAADDNAVKKIGYIGNKRYVKPKVVSTNVTTGTDIFSAVAIKFSARHQPTAD